MTTSIIIITIIFMIINTMAALELWKTDAAITSSIVGLAKTLTEDASYRFIASSYFVLTIIYYVFCLVFVRTTTFTAVTIVLLMITILASLDLIEYISKIKEALKNNPDVRIRNKDYTVDRLIIIATYGYTTFIVVKALTY